MHCRIIVSVGLVAVIVCSGCMRKAKRDQIRETVKSMQAAAEQMQKAGPAISQMEQAAKAMEQAAKATPVEPVDFRELKALLPAELAGMKRTSVEGEKNGAMGMSIAKAEARYENDGASVKITVSDFGGLSGFAAMAQFGWAMQEIDRETENGYEKTITLAGNKAIEKYNKEGKNGEVRIMIKSRFMVEIEGNGIDMAAIKAAAAKLPMDKLAALVK